jgi:hypothetical protein
VDGAVGWDLIDRDEQFIFVALGLDHIQAFGALNAEVLRSVFKDSAHISQVAVVIALCHCKSSQGLFLASQCRFPELTGQ